MMSPLGELRYEHLATRLRAEKAGELVVDSTDALIVFEPKRVVATYAVRAEEIRGELVPTTEASSAIEHPVSLGRREPPVLDPRTPFAVHSASGADLDIRTPHGVLAGAAFRFDDPALDGLVALDFAAFDRWLEEEDEVVGHPRDPYHRTDDRPGSRQIEVRFEGHTLASSKGPHLLLEAMMPVRYYFPREDVRADLLAPSAKRTTCAYKGHASYFSVRDSGAGGEDIAWTYADPLRGLEAIANEICFFNDHVDLLVDGQPLGRPVTGWS